MIVGVGPLLISFPESVSNTHKNVKVNTMWRRKIIKVTKVDFDDFSSIFTLPRVYSRHPSPSTHQDL